MRHADCPISKGMMIGTIEVLERVASGRFDRFTLFGFIPIWRWPTQLERLLANDYMLLIKETLEKDRPRNADGRGREQ